MPFNIALTGLKAAATDLRVTGNNIANVSTTGFKESRTEFANLFSQAYGGVSRTTAGNGVKVQGITQQFAQGQLNFTSNALDLAINGQGFFTLKAHDNTYVFSRAGQFQVDRDGFVVDSAGQKLQGFNPIDKNDLSTGFDQAALDDIRLVSSNAPPLATTKVNARLNLRSDVVEPLNYPFQFAEPPADPNAPAGNDPDPRSYNFATSVTVYDSLGTPRTLTFYYVKKFEGEPPTSVPLTWNMYVGMRDKTGTMIGVTPAGGEQPIELVFTPEGELKSIAGEDVAPTNPAKPAIVPFVFPESEEGFADNGAKQLKVDLDITGMTQYGKNYTVNDLNQNGYTTGRLATVDVDNSGIVFARFTNGQSQVLSQVALSNFKNAQGLAQAGDNVWQEAFAAGDRLSGAPGTGEFGSLQSGALEASNVDLAAQLINLITAQRAYQGNAQTIRTADTLAQTIINLR